MDNWKLVKMFVEARNKVEELCFVAPTVHLLLFLAMAN